MYHMFLKTIKKAFKQAGLAPLNGHGIQTGSMLEYLLCNIPFDVVKVKGRWASDAFPVYLRHHAQILAPYSVYMQANSHFHNSFLCYTLLPVHG